jgi:D-serine deaminase-like pyridoxal phosphate-dependent protein
VATTDESTFARYRRALAGERLPCAFVDRDAFDANVATILALAAGKPLRVATKSIRVRSLVRRAAEGGGGAVAGLMTYDARETPGLVADGFRDLLLAYPTIQRGDVELLARANLDGAVASVVADAPAHLEALDAGAKAVGARIPVLVDVDVAYRPLPGLHLGVLRSPLRDPRDVVEFARRVTSHPHLTFRGVMAYEAQIAGVADRDPRSPAMDAVKRAMKIRSRLDVRRARGAITEALRDAGMSPRVFNGGGTGSLTSSAADPSLTEITAGSGFLASHLFDHYDGVPLVPAAFFALAVTRVPRPGVVTCQGGGYVASGEAGPSRLPHPAWPAGATLLPREGAGEVQTPLHLPRGESLSIGDPVFFRHAKAGELAEHFDAYAIVSGDEITQRAPTYRGERLLG